ncbi:MAG: formylglycine-generating enzyme family protein [Myxococcota bacterium]|jgi:formylglycine-generating enzyme required for sulfatase activity|nr:formylglycine-generating enzyme family protein [Myxococcota bacterium]
MSTLEKADSLNLRKLLQRLRTEPRLREGELQLEALRLRWGSSGFELATAQGSSLRLSVDEVPTMSIQLSRSVQKRQRCVLLDWLTPAVFEERLLVELRAPGMPAVRLSARLPRGESLAELARLDERGTLVDFATLSELLESLLALEARLQDLNASATPFSLRPDDTAAGEDGGVAAWQSEDEGWVLLAPGSFQMGSPENESSRRVDELQHTVELTRPFLVERYPVTQGLFESLMGYNPSDFQALGLDAPVENVSWYEAIAFCNARSREEGLKEAYRLGNVEGKPGERVFEAKVSWLPSATGYRLLTEAEWEYACRAGTSGPYSHVLLDEVAWYADNAGGHPHPVGQKQPNPWGLYDLHGNVWEWVWDWYSAYSSHPQRDPVGPRSGGEKVGRGGSWYSARYHVRSADRGQGAANSRSHDLGFRCARWEG